MTNAEFETAILFTLGIALGLILLRGFRGRWGLSLILGFLLCGQLHAATTFSVRVTRGENGETGVAAILTGEGNPAWYLPLSGSASDQQTVFQNNNAITGTAQPLTRFEEPGVFAYMLGATNVYFDSDPDSYFKKVSVIIYIYDGRPTCDLYVDDDYKETLYNVPVYEYFSGAWKTADNNANGVVTFNSLSPDYRIPSAWLGGCVWPSQNPTTGAIVVTDWQLVGAAAGTTRPSPPPPPSTNQSPDDPDELTEMPWLQQGKEFLTGKYVVGEGQQPGVFENLRDLERQGENGDAGLPGTTTIRGFAQELRHRIITKDVAPTPAAVMVSAMQELHSTAWTTTQGQGSFRGQASGMWNTMIHPSQGLLIRIVNTVENLKDPNGVGPINLANFFIALKQFATFAFICWALWTMFRWVCWSLSIQVGVT